MKLGPSYFYKDLLVNFVKVSVCQSFTFGVFDNLHPEYVKDFELDYLEQVVNKMIYAQGDYSKFLAGKAHELSVEEWEDKLEDELFEKYTEVASNAVKLFLSLFDISEIDIQRCFNIYSEINEGNLDFDDDCNCEGCDCEDCDCEDCDCDECNCGDCNSCDCNCCNCSDNILDDYYEEEDRYDEDLDIPCLECDERETCEYYESGDIDECPYEMDEIDCGCGRSQDKCDVSCRDCECADCDYSCAHCSDCEDIDECPCICAFNFLSEKEDSEE